MSFPGDDAWHWQRRGGRGLGIDKAKTVEDRITVADLVLETTVERISGRAINDRSVKGHARLDICAVGILRNENSVAEKIGGAVSTK